MFTVLKIVVYIFGIDLLADTGMSVWLMYVAATTIVISSIVAITLDNLKARLAYSTISQLAYIVLGAALATKSGILGSGMHIAMHAGGKITLFFCAGAIYVGAHKTLVSELDGLGRKMPFTFGAFFIGSLSIIGLPPFGGAWSKWFLALGAADGHQYVFTAVFMLSSILSIAYLMPVVGRAFFLSPELEAPDDQLTAAHAADEPGDSSSDGIFANLHEAPLLCVLPLCCTAAGCLALFFLAERIHSLLPPIVGG